MTPVITISRQMGSGGRIVSELVRKKLGEPWKIWDKEIIDAIAKKAKIRKELVEEADERVVSTVRGYVADLLGEEFMSLPTYHRYLVESLADIGGIGYAIIMGRGGNFILKDSLNVRLVRPLEERIKHEMNQEEVTREVAGRWISASDTLRAQFIRDLYGKEIGDPAHYDLVINTNQVSLEAAAELIVLAAKRKWKLKMS